MASDKDVELYFFLYPLDPCELFSSSWKTASQWMKHRTMAEWLAKPIFAHYLRCSLSRKYEKEKKAKSVPTDETEYLGYQLIYFKES